MMLLCQQGTTDHVTPGYQRFPGALHRPQNQVWGFSTGPGLSLTPSPGTLAHTKNYFIFLKQTKTSVLGFWQCSSLCRKLSFPVSPNLSSSFEAKQGNHFFQEAFCCYNPPSQNTRTPQSLGYVPPRHPINTVISSDRPYCLKVGPPLLCSLLYPHGIWYTVVYQEAFFKHVTEYTHTHTHTHTHPWLEIPM